MNLRLRLAVCTFALACLFTPSTASSGDRLHEFQACLSACESTNCSPAHGQQQQNVLPLLLRLTRWTCTDDCKYACTHSVTDLTQHESYGRTHQFYGKWPFWRLWGMQEPASVAFSVLNLWVHVRGLGRVRRRVPRGHPMRVLMVGWSLMNVNAWVWSAVFHTRDTQKTEKMDYFSAALAIMGGLHFAVARFFFPPSSHYTLRLAQPSEGGPAPSSNTFRLRLWTALCALVYLAHVSYLSLLPRFDYEYNILFNVVLGLTHNLIWLAYALPAPLTLFARFLSSSTHAHARLTGTGTTTVGRRRENADSSYSKDESDRRRYRPRYARDAAVCVVLTTAAMALELLDFPAVGRVLDAHALWHLATAPIAVLWYRFLIRDALDEGWRGAGASGLGGGGRNPS